MNMVAAVKNEITIVRSGGGHSSARISRENYQNIFCNLLVHHFKRLQINHSSIYGLIILEMDFNLRAEPKQKTDIPPQPVDNLITFISQRTKAEKSEDA